MGSTASKRNRTIATYSLVNSGSYGYYYDPYYNTFIPIMMAGSLYGGADADDGGNDPVDAFFNFWWRRIQLQRQIYHNEINFLNDLFK